MSKQANRGRNVLIRVSAEELEALDRAARADAHTRSSFLRKLLRERLRDAPELKEPAAA
jgi:hypothetical protein